MAGPNPNYEQLGALVNDYFVPKHRQVVFNAAPTLGVLMQSRGRPRSGDMIRQTLTYATTKDGAFFDYAPSSTAAEDKHTPARFEFKNYRQHFTISVPEIKRSSRRPEAVHSMLEEGTTASLAAIRDSVSTDIFYLSGTSVYGDSDAQVHSLPGLVSDNTWPAALTIGQIPKSNTWWRGNVVDGGASFAATHLTQLYWACADGNDKITHMICHNDNADAIDDLASTSGERYIRNPGQASREGFGIEPMITYVKGVPLLVDRHCNTDHIFGLRMPDFELVTMEGADFMFDGFKEPTDQWTRTGWWYWMGDLIVKDARRSGVIKNL